MAEVFKVLSDPTRVNMIQALIRDGEMCVRDLARRGGDEPVLRVAPPEDTAALSPGPRPSRRAERSSTRQTMPMWRRCCGYA